MGTMCGRMVEALLTVARMGLEPSPLPESGQSAGWYFEEYLNNGGCDYSKEYLASLETFVDGCEPKLAS